MRTIVVIVTFFLIVSTVLGLEDGLHYPAGNVDFVSSGAWSTENNGYDFLRTSEVGASVEFDIEANILIVYRTMSASAGTIEVCFDSDCVMVDNSAGLLTNVIAPYGLRSSSSSSHVTITNISGQFDFHYVLVQTDSDLQQVGISPTQHYSALGGQVVAHDFIVTTADIVQIILLSILVFLQAVRTLGDMLWK